MPKEGLELGVMRSRLYSRLARVHRDLDEVPETMANYMQAVQGLEDAQRTEAIEFADLNLEYALYGSEVVKSRITPTPISGDKANQTRQPESREDGVVRAKGSRPSTNKEKALASGIGPSLEDCVTMVNVARDIYTAKGMKEKAAEANAAIMGELMHGIV